MKTEKVWMQVRLLKGPTPKATSISRVIAVTRVRLQDQSDYEIAHLINDNTGD